MDYCYSSAPERLITSNQPLLDAITQELNCGQYQQAILMVGSNRQDNSTDGINAMGGKGSCFPALRRLKDHLKTKTTISVNTDEYLLADTYGHVEPGTSFNLALRNFNGEKFAKSHPNWVFDESKISLLYAQMHHIAHKFPNDEIVFDFYDDKINILEGLQEFYSANPDFIPRRVTLRIHQYNGAFDNNIVLQPIVGTEDHDIDHHTSIKLMAHLTQAAVETSDGHIDGGMVSHYFRGALSGDKLADFKKWRRCEISAVEFKAKYPLQKVEYRYYQETTTTVTAAAMPASPTATLPVTELPSVTKPEKKTKFNPLQFLRKHALLIAISALLALATVAIFCIPVVSQTLGTAVFTGWLINNIALGLSWGGIASTGSLIAAQVLATSLMTLAAFLLPSGIYLGSKALFTKSVHTADDHVLLLPGSNQQMAVLGDSTGSNVAPTALPTATSSPISQRGANADSTAVSPAVIVAAQAVHRC